MTQICLSDYKLVENKTDPETHTTDMSKTPFCYHNIIQITLVLQYLYLDGVCKSQGHFQYQCQGYLQSFATLEVKVMRLCSPVV